MRRAARWDGAIPVMAGWDSGGPPERGQVRELVLFLRGCRAQNGLADRPFDIVIGGASPGGPVGRDLAGPLADLGSRGGMSGCPGVMTWNVPSRSCAGSTRARPAFNRIPRWRGTAVGYNRQIRSELANINIADTAMRSLCRPVPTAPGPAVRLM